MKLIFSIMLLLTTFSSFADQCQYVSLTKSKKAIDLLVDSEKIEALCELCGEKNPSLIKLKSLSMVKTDLEPFWEIKINGKAIDLAYTYINGHNLAQIVGCEAFGVSPVLK